MTDKNNVSLFQEAVYGVAPVALRTAVTHEIPDWVARGVNNINELAEVTGTATEPLKKLLRFLSARGIFTEKWEGYFVLTSLGNLLTKNHPSGLYAWLVGDGIGARMDTAIASLSKALITGRSPYREVNGVEFYDDVEQAAAGHTFNTLRASHAESYADKLSTHYQWPDSGLIADIGGGTGVVLEKILQDRPHLDGLLLDRSSAVEEGLSRLRSTGMDSRVSAVSQSFFDPLPPGADIYLLVNVLHNWPDDEAIDIIRNCALACNSKDSRVIIVERLSELVDDLSFTAMDLRMFLLTGGQERSFHEYRVLAQRAGVSIERRISLPSDLTVLVGVPN